MSSNEPRATLDQVDYASAFRFTRLFECFRIAIHPSRLLLALLLIVLLYIGGRVMDLMWGPAVVQNELQRYVALPADEFRGWYVGATGVPGAGEQGIFRTALEMELRLFDQIIAHAIDLDFGFHHLQPGTPAAADSVIGSLRVLVLIPAWLWQVHPWFLIVYVIVFILLWSLLGGAISRQTMLDAAAQRITPTSEAFAFVWERWGWYLLAPLMPLMIVGAFALLLAVGGFLLLNWPVVNILGALLFPLALVMGFIMALFLIGWLAGVHMTYPALSAEGTDAFDAVARAFSYVIARPWRLVLYTLIALVYGALTYLFVAIVVFLVISLTQWGAGAWVFTETTIATSNGGAANAAPAIAGGGAGNAAAEGNQINRFDAMLPAPEFGRMDEMPALAPLPWYDKVAGVLIRLWVYLLIGLIGAYVISFYFAAYSVIYLLLRRYTDGTDPAEVIEPEPADAPQAEDKIEPAEETQEPVRE